MGEPCGQGNPGGPGTTSLHHRALPTPQGGRAVMFQDGETEPEDGGLEGTKAAPSPKLHPTYGETEAGVQEGRNPWNYRDGKSTPLSLPLPHSPHRHAPLHAPDTPRAGPAQQVHSHSLKT